MSTQNSTKRIHLVQNRHHHLIYLCPRSPEGEGVYCFTSFRPSKIFFVPFFSATIDGRNLIFGHKLHIGMPYYEQRFWTRQIPTFCLPTQLVFIHIKHIWTFFVTFFSATIDDTNLIFGHKLHIGTPYRRKHFWTRQIPASCLPTQLVFMHIEHICTFFVTFFSTTIDDTNLIFYHKLHIGTPYCVKRFWTHQIPTSCLPTWLVFIHIEHICGGIISEHQLTVHLV